MAPSAATVITRNPQNLGELPERDSSKLKKAVRGIGEVFIDGTERDIDRPLDKAAQQACYSGKKKDKK